MYIIALMSGTSLDGVDLVYVRFDELNDFKIMESETIPYSDYWISQLKNIASIPKGNQQLLTLDVELGVYFANLIGSFIESKNISKINLIASHGHTVHHQPEKGYTLQIGCGKEIHNKTSIKTVYDFRTQDIALGGQGAPLVPVGDQLLFLQYDYCLNLGGFSNVSFEECGERKAFDICPVNIVLNYYANQLGFPFDDKGVLSKKGKINRELLRELNELDFYKLLIPKSLGVEFVKKEIVPLILKYNLIEIDVLRTFVEHIAIQISEKLKKGTVLVTGGGAYHEFLLNRVRQLNSNLTLIVPESKIVEYKEALIFALLGKLRVESKINCLSSVTGAKRNHSSGVVFG